MTTLTPFFIPKIPLPSLIQIPIIVRCSPHFFGISSSPRRFPCHALSPTAALTAGSTPHRRLLVTAPTPSCRPKQLAADRVAILTTDMDTFPSPPPPQTQTSASILEAADIFESSLTLETTHYDDGYTDGYKAGTSSGKQDGYEVGVRHGFQLGEELGFYKGLVDVWSCALQLDPSSFSSRVQRSIQQMSELLEQYPVQEPDPEGESVDEMKANLRLKFRAVCASMGVKLEYNGYPKMSDSVETEF